MTHTFETEIVVDPDVPLVRIVRDLAAPASKVFLAHTDSDLVAQWNGPNGTEMRIDHWDCRNGGSYRYLHVLDGAEYGFRGCFHAVRPDELIVQTFTFEGMPNGVALEKLVLDDRGERLTRLTATRSLRAAWSSAYAEATNASTPFSARSRSSDACRNDPDRRVCGGPPRAPA